MKSSRIRKRPFDCIGAAPPPPPIPAASPEKWLEAPCYCPDPELVTAMQIAIAIQRPLLLTGDPGCGKTGAAYFAAWRLGLRPEDLIHEQVRSDASAARLRYEFDAVKYFHSAQAAGVRGATWEDQKERERCLRPGPLWRAFVAAQQSSTVLLLDEIDKAPRDFPNDLLHEFDVPEFTVPDWPSTDGTPRKISGRGGPDDGLLLVVLTSNNERQLPPAFLRRCVHHHLRFDEVSLVKIVEQRRKLGELDAGAELVRIAMQHFVELRGLPDLHYSPSTSEFLDWLQILSEVAAIPPEELARRKLRDLPYLGVLLKNPDDLRRLSA